jgi:1,4-dihydroxy-2-naphthoyl-CoA hydrolase
MSITPPFGTPVEFPLALTDGFDGLVGLELIEMSQEVAVGRVAVREELKQPGGLVHGGVYASIAEALATWGTALAVLPRGKTAVGMSNQTSFLRPITEGAVHARAVSKHRGRTTWVWEVEMSDDDGRLCVLTRMTIAVRDR